MDIQELYQLMARGEQLRTVEFKRSMSWNDPVTKAKITKCILAMSNIRDGGHLVLGVEQQSDGSFAAVGMDPSHVLTYKYDEISSHVATYADPYITFSLEQVSDGGKTFLVIKVEEFNDIPVICKRDGLENLQSGVIYTRTRRMPESARVSNNTEMREILDMAIEKGIKIFVQRLHRVELIRPSVSDEELFNQQLGEL